MNNNGIKKDCTVAGTHDQYTKPEEIKELQKFLKNVKKAYEDNTSLGKDNIGIRGFGDGARMKTVSSLSQNIESLSPGSTRNLETYLDRLGNIKDNDKLPGQNAVPVEGGRKVEVNSLTSHSERIISKEISELESGREAIKGRTENSDKLEDHLEGINGKSENISKLPGNSEKLEGITDQDKLEDHLEDINGKSENISELPRNSEKLEGTIPNEKLSKFREVLGGKKINTSELETAKELILGKLQETKLENHQEKIDNDSKKIHLETERIDLVNKNKLDKLPEDSVKLDEIPEAKLDEHLEKLDISKNNSKLSTTRLDIKPKEVKELSDVKEKLGDIPEIKLENHQEELENVKKNISLDNTRVNLDFSSNKDIDKLPEDSVKLDEIPEAKLDEHLEKLDISKDNSKLSTTRLDIKPKEVKELSDVKENLGNIPEVKLENHQEELKGSNEIETKLDTTRINLEDKEKSITLPQDSEKLTGIQEPSLDKSIESILGDIPEDKLESDKELVSGGEKEVKLGKTRENLVDKRKVSLEDGKESISGNIPEPSLDDFIDTIIDDRDNNIELETQKETVIGGGGEDNNGEITELPGSDDDLVGKIIPKDVPLEDTRLDIFDTRKNNLENNKEELIGKPKDSKLEDTRLDITGIKDVSLENGKLGISGKVEDINSLEGNAIDDDNKIHDSRESSLETKVIKESKNQGGEADALEHIKKRRLSENRNPGDEGKEFDPLSEKLPDQALERTDNKHSDDSKLEDNSNVGLYQGTKTKNPDITSLEYDKTKREKSVTKEPDHLSTQKDDVEDNKNEFKELHDLRKAGKLDDYYKKILLSLEKYGGWGEKVQTLMSRYLSGEGVTDIQANEYLKSLGDSIMISPNKHSDPESLAGKKDWKAVEPMKLPKFSIDSLNINNYLRFVAEKTIGRNWKHSKGLRAALLDTTLATLVTARRALEKATKSNRDRLPGGESALGKLVKSALTGGASGAINQAKSSVLGALTGSGESANPKNRPKKRKKTTGWTGLNDIGREVITGAPKSSSKGFFKKILKTLSKIAKSLVSTALGDTEDYEFQNYMQGEGITVTLKELADTTTPLNVEDLRTALENSEKITTSNTVLGLPVDTQKGLAGDPKGRTTPTRTLDTNTTWELVLQPYCGMLNGYWSYLPSIREINYWNTTYHHIDTAYNLYIPLTGFEMEKNKLNSKSLALFDGEINYPISMEYTNDLRISIADDQYKSWRNYFERCAEVSIYSSEPHNPEYYLQKTITSPTGIDKTHIVVAPYKNISFLCRIYCMTPQYSTINKYTLLLVLKDFSMERTGYVDAGGSDLSVSFSIVGQNVPDETTLAEQSTISYLNIASGKDLLKKSLKNSFEKMLKPKMPSLPSGGIKMI